MDKTIFIAIQEGISLLKRHEYNKACEKLFQSRVLLRESDAQTRRNKIDEINHTLIIIDRTCQELNFQLKSIKASVPHADLIAVTDLVTELKRKKAILKINKRCYVRGSQ